MQSYPHPKIRAPDMKTVQMEKRSIIIPAIMGPGQHAQTMAQDKKAHHGTHGMILRPSIIPRDIIVGSDITAALFACLRTDMHRQAQFSKRYTVTLFFKAYIT
jgi:hypothetical protein